MIVIRVALTFAVMVGVFVAGGVSMLHYIKENYPTTYLMMRYERRMPRTCELVRKALEKALEGEP